MRNAMEKEIKSERTRGNGRELAFTLMPLYALGVGVFAAYKFLKVSHKKSIKVLKLEGNVTGLGVVVSPPPPILSPCMSLSKSHLLLGLILNVSSKVKIIVYLILP